jgi:HSP20 family protein
MKIVRQNNNRLPSIFEEFLPENRLDVVNYDRFSIPSANIIENFSNFVIELAIPGLKKENIGIEIDKNVLKVSSNNTLKEDVEKLKEDTIYTRKEFGFTSFQRTFLIPDTVKKDGIKAGCENGILRIELPKLDEAKNIKRMVEIS